jgi:hypothetical protein
LGKKTSKEIFGILKVCKIVLDENEKLLSEMSTKSRIKENVQEGETFERNYKEWKTANIKSLNLKESAVRKKVHEKGFVKVSDMMGKLRQKENWEIDIEKSINLKENRIGEIYERRKSAKTKKKKLELIR